MTPPGRSASSDLCLSSGIPSGMRWWRTKAKSLPCLLSSVGQWGLRSTDDLWLCHLKMYKFSSVMRVADGRPLVPSQLKGPVPFLWDLALYIPPLSGWARTPSNWFHFSFKSLSTLSGLDLALIVDSKETNLTLARSRMQCSFKWWAVLSFLNILK